MTNSSKPAKVCAACGTDCEGKPRVKDSKGRYLCGPCHEARRSGAASSRPADDEIRVEPEPSASDIIDIAPPVAPVDVRSDLFTACGGCGKPMPASAITCAACGWTLDPSVKAEKPKTKPCPHCGYDLSGTTGRVCPECGKRKVLSFRERNEMMGKLETRRSYRSAVFLTLGSVLFAALAVGAANSDHAGEALMGLGLAMGTATAATVVVYFICQTLWIGQDTVFSLTAARLVAVATTYVAVYSIIGLFLPIPCFGIMVQVLTLVVLLWRILDIDISDATLSGVAIWGVWIGVWLGIAAAATGNL